MNAPWLKFRNHSCSRAFSWVSSLKLQYLLFIKSFSVLPVAPSRAKVCNVLVFIYVFSASVRTIRIEVNAKWQAGVVRQTDWHSSFLLNP
jgi:hypothetical protein